MRVLTRPAVFLAVVVWVGLSLRPTMAAIGPVLDAIQRDTGLSDTGASLLTTLPVALMGCCLFATAQLRRWLGESRGILCGVLLIALSSLLRWSVPNAVSLLVTAVLGGLGIAWVQALLPMVIRQRAGAQAAAWMGAYSTAIMAGALWAGTASPWLAIQHGWSCALGVWAIPALLAALWWWLATRNMANDRVHPWLARPVYRMPRAWLLLSFFGISSSAYTLVLAWLPPYFTGLGWSPQAAGVMLGVVTLAEVGSGLAVSFAAARMHDRRPAIYLAVASLLVGLLGLALEPLQLAWPAALLTGAGSGALFSLSLIVAMDHGETAAEAGAIAGFVQGGGYLAAALLPLVAGILRQHVSDLRPAWLLMAGLCLVLWRLATRLVPGQRIKLHTAPSGE